MFANQPQKTYKFGDALPPIPGSVASWPWPGSPALTKWSVDMLKYPLGTIITDVVDGHPVIAQIQTHTWFGAHPDWPSTPHKGTSVYVPTAVNAAGKKVAIADPPDGWGEEPSTVGALMDSVTTCAPGDPLCTDLPDESAPPLKKHPKYMDTVFLNGSPVSGFGVGARFAVVEELPHPAVQGTIRTAVNPPIHPGVPLAQVHALALREASSAVERAHGAFTVRRPAVASAIHIAAREKVIAHAWRPEWGTRPQGFGATRWLPAWGRRPAWFGARQWNRQWGAQPAWWTAHINVLQVAPPEQDDAGGGDAPAASNGKAATSSDTPAASSDPSIPADTATATTAPDATPSTGMSTLAKVGIGVGVVAAVGGTIAIIKASGKK